MDNFDFIFGHFNAVGIVEFRQRPMDYIYWIGVLDLVQWFGITKSENV